jgi:ATP/maltotriose-dependent transcriptional regulator MalT
LGRHRLDSVPGRLEERDRELQVIVDALDEVSGGRGGAVVVSGVAGIGKTSVLELARDAAQDRSFAVASARGSDLESAYAWGVVRQLLEPRLRGMSASARNRTLAGAAALAGPIVLPDAALPGVDADASFGVLHGLYWLVAGLAAQRPQLLVVDDLHWADDASIRFLEFLTNRVDAVPVLLLAAQRPPAASVDGALRGATLVTSMELAPLSLEATGTVLAQRGGAPVPASFAQACHGATGGNPLLIRRLAEGLRERGVEDAEGVTRLGPYVVAEAVGASLARLGEGPARLADAAAVLERAPLITAARLAGLETREASAFGEQLVRAGILRDARPLEFQHALVRDAVLSALTAGERARLHADAAAILTEAGAPPEAVAVHLLHAEPRGDPAVVSALAEAGRRGLASGALSEAAACLERALAEPAAPTERSALLLDLARAEHGSGRTEALDHVIQASDAAGDEVAYAQAALALMWASGPGRQDPQEAAAMIERAIAGVSGRDRELGLRLEAVRLMAIFMSPQLMQQALGAAERFAGLEGRTPGECELLLHVAIHRFRLGRPAVDVAEPLERFAGDPELLAAVGTDSAWLVFVLGALFKTDRLDAARRTVAIAAAEARRRGSVFGFAVASVWRAWIELREGSAAEAEADARAAYEALPAGVWQHSICASCLIEVLVERGELEEAQAVLAASGGEDAITTGVDWLYYARSIVRAARGDMDGALADQLASRPPDSGSVAAPDPDFDGWVRIARLLHATGNEAAAMREADAALDWARVWDTPGYIGQALTASGLILGGDEGLARLRDGVAQLERSPARRELAGALVELGAALRRRGERVAAREPLRRALDIASRGGLVAIAERSREELRVTGAKLRRPSASGLDSLTPSERRIVDLAAEGASNPEIAQALFVTVKTVEMHLGNAYRKLDISSRRQLAPLLRAAQP